MEMARHMLGSLHIARRTESHWGRESSRQQDRLRRNMILHTNTWQRPWEREESRDWLNYKGGQISFKVLLELHSSFICLLQHAYLLCESLVLCSPWRKKQVLLVLHQFRIRISFMSCVHIPGMWLWFDSGFKWLKQIWTKIGKCKQRTIMYI